MTTKSELCNRLSAIGIRQDRVHSLVDQVTKWVNSNGEEWTVQRLKEIKQIYLKKLAGEEYTPDQWIKKDGKGYPTGPFGKLFKEYGKQPVRVLNALQAYTAYRAVSPTAKQLKKFLGSVEQPRVSPRVEEMERKYSKSLKPKFTNREIKGHPRHYSEAPWSDSKRAPLLAKKRLTVSERTGITEWASDIALLDVGKPGRSSGLRLPEYLNEMHKLKQAAGFFTVRSNPTRGTMSQAATSGHIGFIQEPGFKLRAVANPYRGYQLMLDPLKTSLMGLLKRYEEDCTHDQSKGINRVQGWLKDKRVVHCVDLSDATNNIPLGPQIELLRKVFKNDPKARSQIQLFENVSRGSWLLPDGKTKVRWTRGQPLGLGPSFGSFALWHNESLRALRAKHGGNYVVLGDDVAIVGTKLHQAYRQMMQELRVPISEGKCFTSDKLAEFGGRVITPDRSYVLGKWREMSDRNFVDLARQLGPQSISMFRPRQRFALKLLSAIPEDMGGLGWNRDGLPLEERLAVAYELGVLRTKDEGSTFVSFESSSAVRRNVELRHAASGRLLYPGPEEMGEKGITTSDTLSRVNALSGVTSGQMPLESLKGDLHPASPPDGDPRGQSRLDQLERNVKTSLSSSEDEGTGPTIAELKQRLKDPSLSKEERAQAASALFRSTHQKVAEDLKQSSAKQKIDTQSRKLGL